MIAHENAPDPPRNDDSAASNLAAREVDALTPDSAGCWLVTTQGSTHVWDLDAMTYTRRPGPASLSGAFDHDERAMPITRVQRWPRVGQTSLVWFDDPEAPAERELSRQSSTIVSITALPGSPSG
ncbi:hypothetical protein FIV07_06995 [Mycobacterium sp. THAF192]|nr:hypothetical protein FIV07_06995 [Mycobacterium sp. THAF192]